MNLKRYPNLPGSPASVTSLIKACFPRPELRQKDLQDMGIWARKFPNEPLEGLRKRHKDWSTFNRGKAVSKSIELDLQGLPPQILDHLGQEYFEQWRNWFPDQKLEVVATDVTVWNPEHRYADTVRLMAIDSATGERVLVDWKTCAEVPREPYFDNVVQVCAYMMATKMYQEGSGIPSASGTGTTAPVHSLGLLVYISPKEVKAFDIQGELLARGRQAWLGTLDIAKALYPELMA